MKDIFKSGALGLTVVAMLIFASASSKELENSKTLNKKEEISVVDTIDEVEKEELKNKKDIHTPL